MNGAFHSDSTEEGQVALPQSKTIGDQWLIGLV
jgi:hypothetical protein